jgi:hypothetical protein
MEPDPFWQANSSSVSQYIQSFMAPKGSLQYT